MARTIKGSSPHASINTHQLSNRSFCLYFQQEVKRFLPVNTNYFLAAKTLQKRTLCCGRSLRVSSSLLPASAAGEHLLLFYHYALLVGKLSPIKACLGIAQVHSMRTTVLPDQSPSFRVPLTLLGTVLIQLSTFPKLCFCVSCFY